MELDIPTNSLLSPSMTLIDKKEMLCKTAGC